MAEPMMKTKNSILCKLRRRLEKLTGEYIVRETAAAGRGDYVMAQEMKNKRFGIVWAVEQLDLLDDEIAGKTSSK